MRNYLKLFALLVCLSTTLVSCRDENKKDSMDGTEMNDMDTITNDASTENNATMEKDANMADMENVDRDMDGELDEYDANVAADKMNMESDAEVKVKEEKIKMEDSEKEVKIKTEDDGTVEKVKVEYKDEAEK